MSRTASSSPGSTPARRCALEVLRRTFEHGAWADRAFRSAAERHGLAGRDLAFAQWLAYGSVQRRGTSDHLVERLTRRPVAGFDPPVVAALRLGLFELLFTGSAADHAAVGEAVELAKRGMRAGERPERAEGAAGLVNAVLRRAARERGCLLAELTDRTPEEAAAGHSYPLWIARRWWEELGPDAARTLMRAMNEPAETALRVNTLRADRSVLLAELRSEGEILEEAGGRDHLLAPEEALISPGAWGKALRARVASGEVIPQSRASQAVVALLDPSPGELILDLCAGPGIKSTQIAARLGADGEVRALELDATRAAEISELAGRTGSSCLHVVVGDAAKADLGEGYDRVLVDPPCTDLGTLASRPDARWRKTEDQADRLAPLQLAILKRAGAALRPGGTLVYSTCTISRQENEDVVASALEADGQLAADNLGSAHPRLASPHDSRFLQTRPDRDLTAGFFMARLRKAEG